MAVMDNSKKMIFIAVLTLLEPLLVTLHDAKKKRVVTYFHKVSRFKWKDFKRSKR